MWGILIGFGISVGLAWTKSKVFSITKSLMRRLTNDFGHDPQQDEIEERRMFAAGVAGAYATAAFQAVKMIMRFVF